MTMEDYMGPVIAQLRETFEPTYTGLGLALDCRPASEEDGRRVHYEITFRAGERVFLPLSLFFAIPTGDAAPATLQDAAAVVNLYSLEELSSNGWYKYHHLEESRLDLTDSDEEILDQLGQVIDCLAVVDDDYTRPLVVRNTYLVMAHDTITRFERHLLIERDMEREVERYVFNNIVDQQVRVCFPFSGKAWVEVDDRLIGEFDGYDRRELDQLLVKACGKGFSTRW